MAEEFIEIQEGEIERLRHWHDDWFNSQLERDGVGFGHAIDLKPIADRMEDAALTLIRRAKK